MATTKQPLSPTVLENWHVLNEIQRCLAVREALDWIDQDKRTVLLQALKSYGQEFYNYQRISKKLEAYYQCDAHASVPYAGFASPRMFNPSERLRVNRLHQKRDVSKGKLGQLGKGLVANLGGFDTSILPHAERSSHWYVRLSAAVAQLYSLLKTFLVNPEPIREEEQGTAMTAMSSCSR